MEIWLGNREAPDGVSLLLWSLIISTDACRDVAKARVESRFVSLQDQEGHHICENESRLILVIVNRKQSLFGGEATKSFCHMLKALAY